MKYRMRIIHLSASPALCDCWYWAPQKKNIYLLTLSRVCCVLMPRLHDTTGRQSGCITGLTTGLTTVLNEQPLFVQPVVKSGCTTGLTTGCIHDTAGCQAGCQRGLTTGCIVYTSIHTNIQPVVKPLWQPAWQRVVSCKRGLTTKHFIKYCNRRTFDSRMFCLSPKTPTWDLTWLRKRELRSFTTLRYRDPRSQLTVTIYNHYLQRRNSCPRTQPRNMAQKLRRRCKVLAYGHTGN